MKRDCFPLSRIYSDGRKSEADFQKRLVGFVASSVYNFGNVAISNSGTIRLRVTAIDISRTACDMAFINTTLWGVPTRVIHGNSLSLETWAAWSNIHYIAPWLPLALRIQSPEAMEQGQPPKPAEVERIKASLGQQELMLE